MKLLTTLFIALISLTLITSCSNEFKPSELEVNPKFEKRFKIIDYRSLEESEDALIDFISDVEIDGNRLYIIDSGFGNLLVYDLNTGQQLKIITPGIELSDSLAADCKPPLTMHKRDYEYIDLTIKNHKKIVPLDRALGMNNFRKIYIDENINILATLRAYCFKKDKHQDSGIVNTAANVEYDKNYNLKNVNSFEISPKGCPIGFDFIKTQNGEYFVTTSSNIRQFYQNKLDSLPIIGRYNKDGFFGDVVEYLDKNYTESELGYKLDFQASLTKINNTVFMSVPYSEKIFNLTENTAFNLINLPFTNTNGFEYLKNHGGVIDTSEIKFIDQLLPVYTKKTFSTNNTLIVITNIYNNNKNKGTRYIQEYSAAGDLIRQGSIEGVSKNGEIQFIYYNKSDGMFYLFRKNSKKGWTLEIVKWE